MPTLIIKSGDTLSKIAAANGTSVDALVAANKGNAAVKSANLIIAGGTINLPDKVAVPAAGPAEGAQLPPGGIAPPPVGDQGAKSVGDLGNLRMALREALNEAARKRVENNYKQVAPLSAGLPGTIGSVVDMIRGGIKPTVEQTFSDIVTTFKDANEAKQKELDKINQLRLEYGSAIPADVTDLKTAIDLVSPLVDAERKLKLSKMASDQAEDNDIQSWAESFAKGEITIGNVPAKIRTAVKVAADKIKTQLETDAKKEYKDRIAYRIERKVSDYNTERSQVLNDDNLNVAEQREVVDYIDTLEQSQKAAKSKQPANAFFGTDPNLFGGLAAPGNGPNVPSGASGGGFAPPNFSGK